MAVVGVASAQGVTAASPAAASGTTMGSMPSSKVVVIRIAHVTKANSPKGKATIKFKEDLEARFPGRVRVEAYEDNKLFKDREELEALELGAVDVIIPTFGKLANAFKVPEFQVFDLPFLFDTDRDVLNYINSSSAQKLLGLMNAKSKTAEAIAIWPLDFRVWSGPQPYKKPDDFKPYSFRVESQGMGKKTFEAFKAKGTTQLAFTEVAAALKKQGEYKLDGAENPLSNFWSIKLYESQPHITESNHNYLTYGFVVNKRFLNSLPPDIKTGFIDLARSSSAFHLEVALQEREELKKQIADKGVKFYKWTPEEKEAFKKAVVPVHEDFMKNINKDFLLETYEVIRSMK